MAYVAPRTRALRAKRRSRLSDAGRGLPPGNQHPPSPPAFWIWFDDIMSREDKDRMDYALNGPDLQANYYWLVKNRWAQVKGTVQRVLQLGAHPYSDSTIRPGMVNQ